MMRARNTDIPQYEKTSNAGRVAAHLTQNHFVSGDVAGVHIPAAAERFNHPASTKHRQNLDDVRPSGHPNDRAGLQDPADSGAAPQSATTDARESHRAQSRQNAKRLRAAEARRQFELLQEKRLLQDHLADFWDPGLDKKRR